MEILVELVNAMLTIGGIVAIALIMAGLFIIVLSLATGIDNAIQPGEEDR